MTAAPKIKVVNQLISDESGVYRVQHGDRVGYITISTDVFDEDTMCRPYLLIPQLPVTRHCLDTHDHFTKPIQQIRRRGLEQPAARDRDPLASSEVPFENSTAIVKYAPFDWEIRRLKRETWAYGWLEEHRKHHPGCTMLVPKVLAHVTEEGRVIGLLLQKVEGDFAGPEDYDICKKAILEIHEAGLVHGDVNRYNFVVNREQNRAVLIDLEHAEEFDEVSAQRELDSLASELSEATGRGGPAIPV